MRVFGALLAIGLDAPQSWSWLRSSVRRVLSVVRLAARADGASGLDDRMLRDIGLWRDHGDRLRALAGSDRG